MADDFDTWLSGSPLPDDDDSVEHELVALRSRVIRLEDATAAVLASLARIERKLETLTMQKPEIPEGTDPAALVAACANALRVWTTYAAGVVGAAETKHILAGELLSVSQATMTAEEIAIMLRELARRVEVGELSATMQ